MPKSHVSLNSFNAGEWSDSLSARHDLAKYNASLRRCENWLPTVQGNLVTRSGTRFIANSQDSNKKQRLIPFQFNNEQSYIIEVGAFYMRFYNNYGQILGNGGQPYQVVTPYDEAACLELKYDQSNDVMTLCHQRYAPMYLKRFAHNNWVLERVTFNPPPFDRLNSTNTVMQASATTGTVTITTNAPLIDARHLGAQIKLTEITASKYNEWKSDRDIENYANFNQDEYRRYENKVYRLVKKAGTNNKTGVNPPIHTTGTESDGEQDWVYIDNGVGIIKVVQIVGTQEFRAEVIRRIPRSIVAGATKDYYMPLWYEGQWPVASTYFQGRHYFALNQTINGSVINEYENFNNKDNDGEITDEMAVSYTFNSQRANIIEWLEENGKGLSAGTSGGEFAIVPGTGNAAITPKNPPIIRQSTNVGCADLKPVRTDNTIIYLQKNRKALYEIAYSFQSDGFNSTNLNIFSEHIGRAGIKDMAFQRQPQPIVWCATNDGELLGLTYNKEQDVLAWHRHRFGGNFDQFNLESARVESLAVISSPDGTREDLWLDIERYVAGGRRKYIEVMQPLWDETKTLANAWMADSALQYLNNDVPVTTVSGLAHLEGEIVKVFASGTVLTKTVNNGQVDLDGQAYNLVVVGLPYSCFMETQRIEGGSADGTSQGKTKRINEVELDLLNSSLGFIGDPEQPLESWDSINQDGDVYNFTGVKRLQFPGDYNLYGRIGIRQNTPLPIIIRGIYVHLTTNG